MLKVFRSGPSAANSGKCKMARIWHGVSGALDDQDPTSVDLVWMLSHTVAADVSVKVLSNGGLLTSHDR